jgi:hypothetical protein
MYNRRMADQNPNPTNAGRAANTEQKTRTGLSAPIINTGAIVGKSVGAISIFIGLGSTGEAYGASAIKSCDRAGGANGALSA